MSDDVENHGKHSEEGPLPGKTGKLYAEVWADDLAPSAHWHSTYFNMDDGGYFLMLQPKGTACPPFDTGRAEGELNNQINDLIDSNNDSVWKQRVCFICIMHVCMHMYVYVCVSQQG